MHKALKAAIPSLRSKPSLASSIRTGSDNYSLNSNLTASTSQLTEFPRSGRDFKKKSPSPSFFSTIVRRTRSKSRLRPGRLDLTGSADHPVPPLPPSPDYIPYAPPPPASPPAHPSSSRLAPLLGKGKKAADVPPPVPSKDTEYHLSKDLDHMEGIVDFDIYFDLQNGAYENAPSSPSSGLESSIYSSPFTSDGSSAHHYHHASTSSLPSGSRGIFSNPNPFQTPSAGMKRKAGPHDWDHRNVSPKNAAQFSASVPTIRGHEIPSWQAPESWAVEPIAGSNIEDAALAEDTSSEGEDGSQLRSPGGRRKAKRRHTLSVSDRPPRGYDDRDGPYRIRIYRRDNTYHVATVRLRATVNELVPHLNGKMLLDTNREMHRLYLKERGRGGRHCV